MPVLAIFYGIVIRLLRLPALGPRIHAFYGDAEWVFDLESGRIVSSQLPLERAEQVLGWVREHRRAILAQFPVSTPTRPAVPATQPLNLPWPRWVE